MDQRLEELIAKSNNIVFFGGAGVSTESGIPAFTTSSGSIRRSRSSATAFLKPIPRSSTGFTGPS